MYSTLEQPLETNTHLSNPEPVYVTKTALPSKERYIAMLDEIWASQRVTNGGPLCQQLETRLSNRFSTPTQVVANGTLAIQIALRALDLQGSVLTTPFSYVATTNALLWERLQPIFVDVEDRWLTIDPELIENAIRPDTTAILATHVYGYPCDVEALERIAAKHKLRLIYDAAHAFGVTLGGRSLMAYGDISTLSFHATKVFHTFEGGGISCRDTETGNLLHLLRTFGHEGQDYRCMGVNAKMSELHAAAGLLNLDTVDALIEMRSRISAHYRQLLATTPLRIPDPADIPNFTHNHAYFPVFCRSHGEREALVAALEEQGIFPRRYFDPSLNELPFLDSDVQVSCPVSERASRTVMCLPLYPELPVSEASRIAETVLNFYDG